MDSKSPSKIDEHIGERLRERRKALGLSLEELAEALGISYQQMQKYENGRNRVAAGRLYELAKRLGTSIPYFYEDAPGVEAHHAHAAAEGAARFDASLDNEALALLAAFQSIEDPKLRKSILASVKKQASAGKKKKP